MKNQSQRPLSILMLEDNPLDADLVRHALNKGGLEFSCQLASNEQEFHQALQNPFDIILADYNLPQYDAQRALNYLQEHDLDIPFIIVSGSIGEELAVQVMKKGASDYLLKDRLGRLATAIRNTCAGKRQAEEKQQVEQAYRESEARYYSMFHNNHTVMLFLDPESDMIVDANSAAEVFYGWTRQTLMTMSWSQICEEKAIVHQQNIRAVLSEKQINFESNHQNADGSIRHVEVNICPISVENRQLLFAIIRDVSQRKQMESLISNVFQSMGEALAVIDRDHVIIAANRAYCEMTTQPLEKVIGKQCDCTPPGTFKPNLDENHICPAEDTFASGIPKAITYNRPGDDGHIDSFDISAFPIKDIDGQVGSVIMVYNDITERRKLEAQLRQSQKMEAIGTLTGGIAHDFNNILTAIVGNVTLLGLKMQEEDPLIRFVDNIKDATDRASTLTQGLLAFSRKQVLNPEAVNLNQTIQGMEHLLQRLISEDIDLSTNLLQQEITALVDQGQLEQVIMNLVVNSRDALEDGGKIHITTESAEINDSFINIHGFGEQGRYARICVRDTGTGMDQKTKERIFEPFFTTKGVGKGTGLGLSTVYGIIKQHNGFIVCNSTPGQGTEFQIYLPMTEIEDKTDAPVAVSYVGGQEAIFLVEDDQYVRMMLKEILQEAGYTIDEAADGAEAIEKFKGSNNNIGLVILDVIMPGMNGKETFIELKKIKPDIKAIFISGYTGDIIHKKGLREENIHFLPKPLNPKDLLNKIRTVLDETS